MIYTKDFIRMGNLPKFLRPNVIGVRFYNMLVGFTEWVGDRMVIALTEKYNSIDVILVLISALIAGMVLGGAFTLLNTSPLAVVGMTSVILFALAAILMRR